MSRIAFGHVFIVEKIVEIIMRCGNKKFALKLNTTKTHPQQ